jgi:hypothetical protein
VELRLRRGRHVWKREARPHWRLVNQAVKWG